MNRYDAVVIGSGPNGLAAAIRLAMEGVQVVVMEASGTIGGGMRTQALMQPDVLHDICSAIHPMAASSPFMQQLPLNEHGLEWIHPELPLAHPLDDRPAVAMHRSVQKTAAGLGADQSTYRALMEPLVEQWDGLTRDFLGPLSIPRHPIQLARFGMKALLPATLFRHRFKTVEAQALFAGIAAHSILPLNSLATTAIGLVLGTAGHAAGWPLPKGGSQQIAESMASLLRSLGGEIETDRRITDIRELGSPRAILFDVTPKQVVAMAGHRFPDAYNQRLEAYRYGNGVFKIDYILREPVPWKDADCRRAGTVHLGGTFDEIARSEAEMDRGVHPEKPYVLVAQQSLFDESRTPDNRHTLWAYCHVPPGSTTDMTRAIEQQIERYAPGFQDVVMERRTMHTGQFHAYNANYIGGDINGGRQDITQLFTRPHSFIRPYATASPGLYICSSSTPPGGGVHGMCGYHAATLALRERFGLKTSGISDL
ncbi:MAG: phytoene desaturase family protein [Balneolaceae bacterium]